MPQQKNIRPTSIYWLYDTRPETVAVYGIGGLPFYCGKTDRDPAIRLKGHRGFAITRPDRPLSQQIMKCGDHIGMRIVEIVPTGSDWAERERYWIKKLRSRFPSIALNISDGGDGASGWIPTPKTRARMSASHIGKVHSLATIAKMSATKSGKPKSADHIANMRASRLGKKRSAETMAKIRDTKLWWATLRAKVEAHRASH